MRPRLSLLGVQCLTIYYLLYVNNEKLLQTVLVIAVNYLKKDFLLQGVFNLNFDAQQKK